MIVMTFTDISVISESLPIEIAGLKQIDGIEDVKAEVTWLLPGTHVLVVPYYSQTSSNDKLFLYFEKHKSKSTVTCF